MAETELGPQGFDGIAIVGSAPSSVQLAPYNDMSWAIWACSPGVFGVATRSDAWFELHRFHPAQPGKNTAPGTKPWFSSEYTAFLAQHKLVFMNALYPEIPRAVRYPFEKMIEKYGRYHFTSSVAWMLALAIECKPKRIGLWGIDMAATEEYSYQRPGCQHFIGLAMSLGIEVILPPESDLMQPPAMYGISELNPRHIKIRQRIDEFNTRIAALTAQQEQTVKELMFLSGARDDANYMLQSWSDDIPFEPQEALSFAGHANEATAINVPQFQQAEATQEAEYVEPPRKKSKSNGAAHP